MGFECPASGPVFGENGVTQTAKLDSIQALRGIAVLGVVGFHMLAMERKYSGGDLLLPQALQWGQLGVDLFFAISGFVMVMVTQGRFQRAGEVPRFLWHRLTRIYPTYWFYFLLTLAVFLIKPDWVNASQGHQADLLSSLFLYPTDTPPLVMVAWSLIHELWFYAVFALLLLLPEKWLPWLLLTWGLCIAVVNQAVDLNALPAPARIALHGYTLEFILGALAALCVYRLPIAASRFQLQLLQVGALIGLGVAFIADIASAAPHWRAATVGGLSALLLFCCAVLERRGQGIQPGLLHAIGNASYTIYLSHLLVLGVIGRLWQLVAVPGSPWDNLLAYALMLSAVVVYGFVGLRFIERPALALAKRLHP